MVLRSGIIIPFQFRDCKKLLMIGVPEENRDLSIWDLKNVVRAAFGIYNFEFRNKKIGFIIPDELLLHYLAQRHDLTNFVIEIGQVYDPCKDNYTVSSNCPTCRSAAIQKSALDMHESVSISTHHPASAHSNISGANSQSSQNDEPPPHKLRIAHMGPAGDVSHMEIEPKIDYDTAVPAGGIATDTEDSPPPPSHSKSTVGFLEEDQQQQTHHQSELHFERLQHEYFMQQQHQQQQQQQQQQQHMEAMMQETAANSLRQRKDRMSKKQKDVYVNFLEQHPLINEHRRNDPALDRYWIKLADILNSVPQGAVKHVAEWKQTFDNWRYRVFLYARYNSKITGEEALNPKSFKPLTHTDKRAYHIWIRNPDTAPPDLDKMRNVFANLEETQQE